MFAVGSKKTLKILNNGSTVVILLIDSLPILVAFDTKMLPRRGGRRPGGVRNALGLWGPKKHKKTTENEAQGNTIWSPLGTLGRPLDDIWGSRWIHGHPFFACFFRFDFRLVFSWIFNGFEGRKGTIFYSIFEFFAARAIFANCEFYLRKTYIFHVWEA